MAAKRKKTDLQQAQKPSIGLPDGLEAALEEARHAKEGALKLQRAVEALRSGLELIVSAEMDNMTRLPVTAPELRSIAAKTLDEYSRMTGQSWRRHPLVGSWAGDRSDAGDYGNG